MSQTLSVYALVDNATRTIRYIGQTTRDPRKRLSQHITTAKKKTTPPVNAWMRGLMESGSKVEMVVIDECHDRALLNDAEIYWIEQFRAMGAELLNISSGGETRTGYRHSEETKARWRRDRCGENAPMYGKHRTPEEKAHMSAKVKERWATVGHPCCGRKRTPETIAKLKAAKVGWAPSPEHAAALRAGLRKHWDGMAARRAEERKLCETP